MKTLSAETAQLGTPVEGDVLFLARHDGAQPIALTSAIGKRLPASSTAVGKAMLARLRRLRHARVQTQTERRLVPGSIPTELGGVTRDDQRNRTMDRLRLPRPSAHSRWRSANSPIGPPTTSEWRARGRRTRGSGPRSAASRKGCNGRPACSSQRRPHGTTRRDRRWRGHGR